MRRLCLSIASIVCVCSLVACADDGPDDQPQLDPAIESQIDAVVRQRIASQRLPGVVVLVSIPGRGTYRRAFGEADLLSHAPRRVDDPFRIASITKTFIGTAVLQLVDDGRLSLADPLAKWYPAFPRAAEITVDDLLRMRSGIPDAFDDDFMKQYYADPTKHVTADDLIARSAARSRDFIPRDTVTRYTNINFVLLEQIAVKIAGEPIAALLERRILGPLGMRDTSYPSGTALAGTTHGYALNAVIGAWDDKTALDPTIPGGSGAIVSTLADLERYARALCTGTLLQPGTQRLRLAGTAFDGEPAFVRYGRGVFLLGRFCGHNGTIFGFSSEMFYLPEKDAVIVIDVNRLDLDDKSQSEDLFLAIAKILFPESVDW